MKMHFVFVENTPTQVKEKNFFFLKKKQFVCLPNDSNLKKIPQARCFLMETKNL